jgi:hypothetical protein
VLILLFFTGLVLYRISLIDFRLAVLGAIFGNSCDPQNPSEIESVARIKLPPSYRNLASNCGGMQGWGADARFEINPTELDLFLETTNIKPPLTPDGLPTQPQSVFLSLEDRENLTAYLYGSYDSFDWREEIIVDTSDPNGWVIYFSVLAG